MSEGIQRHREFVPGLDELQEFSRERRIVDEIQRGHSALRSRQHKEFRTALARIYAIAYYLREVEDAWLDFCRDEAWSSYRRRPKKSDQGDALRYVIRIAVGFSGRAATKRASKYYKKLSGWFTAETPPKVATNQILRNKPCPTTTRGPAPDDGKQPRQKEECAIVRIPLDQGGRGVLEKGHRGTFDDHAALHGSQGKLSEGARRENFKKEAAHQLACELVIHFLQVLRCLRVMRFTPVQRF